MLKSSTIIFSICAVLLICFESPSYGQSGDKPEAAEVEASKEAGSATRDEDKNSQSAKKVDDETRAKLIEKAVERLVELQHDDGAWPYEGVYRVRSRETGRAEIPVGYRIGGTSIACSALISAPLKDRTIVKDAVTAGARMVLKELEHRLMEPSRTQRYDVRIWGHIYALDFFCRLKEQEQYGDLLKDTNKWIPKLVEAVVFQECEGGGWNYQTKEYHCCFVTSPAVQALLLAKQAGMEVPGEVLERSSAILKKSRKADGVIPYSNTRSRRDTQAGSIARAPVTEATLLMLGEGDQEKLQFSIDKFHQHWDELEKRRKKNGTHLPPHGIAPYYFYFAHRYAAQAIRMLPATQQVSEFDKFVPVLLKTKDEDNTWNDRVFEQSKAYGTAMSVLALSRDSVQLPKLVKADAEKSETEE